MLQDVFFRALALLIFKSIRNSISRTLKLWQLLGETFILSKFILRFSDWLLLITMPVQSRNMYSGVSAVWSQKRHRFVKQSIICEIILQSAVSFGNLLVSNSRRSSLAALVATASFARILFSVATLLSIFMHYSR